MLNIKNSGYYDSPWVPDAWGELPFRILILGDFGWGDDRELNGSANWVPAYLKGRVVDKVYTRVSNALQLQRSEFWERVAFVNYIYKSGAAPSDAPSVREYRAAAPRFSQILDQIKPSAVWVWGIGQSTYSAPILTQHGIPHEITKYPGRATHIEIAKSWERLLELKR